MRAADRSVAERLHGGRRRLPPRRAIVRGVYATMYSLWGSRWTEYYLPLIADTELNSVVVDVKDDRGRLAWRMDLPLARRGGGARWRSAGDPRGRLRALVERGGYPIARVVCFKDSKVATARPGLAVVDARDGEPWQGRDGQHWLNPYRQAAWRYCIDVGVEAAEMGFREVQFDYVRFPNGGDGPVEHARFPGVPGDRPREQWRHPDVITAFLAEARRRIHDAGAYVSADVFGLTTYSYSWDGDGTGQVLERLAAQIDYLSPMVYPSHYGPGNYGLRPHPVDFPYETVRRAMEEARMRSQGLRARIRPWLEDFAPTWLGRSHSPQRVRRQKQAVYDAGLEGWMLWNAGNDFSEAALADRLRSRADPDYEVAPRTRQPVAPPGRTPRR